MRKKLTCIALGLILGLVGSISVGCGSKGSPLVLYKEGMEYTETQKIAPGEVYALTYDFLGGSDVMPIGGFYAPYASGGSDNGNQQPDFLTDYFFQAIADCGINMMFYSQDRWSLGGTNTSLNKALDLCEKYGIGYYVDSYYVLGQLGTRTQDYPLESMELATDAGKEKLSQLVDELTDNGRRKCVLGILGQDEPFTAQLDNLGVLHDAFYGLENTQGMDIHINAIGYWAGENNFWGYSDPLQFEQYMQMYFDEVQPAMLSVTQYPFRSANTPESLVTTLLYNQLSIYRKLANDHQVPFWRMLAAGGQWNDLAQWIESVDPYPSEAELLFDVNVALAYGAKAIQYFPLIQPFYFAYEAGGTYDFENRNSLIGADGNLTRWYYYAKRANTQVQAVDEYLMHSTNDGIIVHGENATKAIITDGKPGEEIIYEGKYRELTSVAGDDCIVGCFNYKGGTALYIVNYSRTSKADVQLNFDRDDYLYEVIQRAESTKVVGGSIPLRLDCGEGALIVLK